MKKSLVILALLCGATGLYAQLTVGSGATLTATSGSTLAVREMSITNNGTLTFNTGSTITLINSAPQSYSGTAATFHNLTKDSAGVFGFNNLTVNGTLTMNNGRIDVSNGSVLTLGTTASIVGEATGRFISGNIQTTRSLTGATPINIGGMGVSINPSGSNMGSTVVTRVGGAGITLPFFPAITPGGSTGGIRRTWQIAPTNSAPNVTVQFSWVADDDNGKNLANGIIWISEDNGVSWTNPFSSFDYSSRAAVFTRTISAPVGVRFSVTDLANPLPVELSSFSAKTENGRVVLNWTTASEKNNAGFEVQRKVDSGELIVNSWTVLGFVKGKGTTSEAQSYSFVDRTASGKVQYRLKQIDFDGQFEILPTVEADAGLPRTFVLEQNYPNPFNPTTSISYQLPVSGQVSLKVFDMLGREVATLVNESKAAGRYSALFNAPSLTSGIYFYRLQAGTFTETKKMILVK